jgi:hypothetical protein
MKTKATATTKFTANKATKALLSAPHKGLFEESLIDDELRLIKCFAIFSIPDID